MKTEENKKQGEKEKARKGERSSFGKVEGERVTYKYRVSGEGKKKKLEYK